MIVCLFRKETPPGAAALVEFIDAHRDRIGVKPISAVLEFSVSSYYYANQRAAESAARETRDAMPKRR